VAGAAVGTWVQRVGGPAQRRSKLPARATEDGRAGAGALSGKVLRPERAAFPGETACQPTRG
jgi:hypothetical protein